MNSIEAAESAQLNGLLLRGPTRVPDQPDVATWWPQYLAITQHWQTAIARAVLAGFSADRLAWAFCGGYQAALHQLTRPLSANPILPTDALAAFCATEKTGNHPRAIQSTLTPDGDGFLRLTTIAHLVRAVGPALATVRRRRSQRATLATRSALVFIGARCPSTTYNTRLAEDRRLHRLSVAAYSVN